jgi:hypothetical protein
MGINSELEQAKGSDPLKPKKNIGGGCGGGEDDKHGM